MSEVVRTVSGIPGEIVVGGADVSAEDPFERILNEGRPVITMVVTNMGDRPVQVGSHFHFAEVNTALDFDRTAAWGKRLDVAAGTSVRFEAGIERTVHLIPFVGKRRVPGLRGLVGGALDPPENGGDR